MENNIPKKIWILWQQGWDNPPKIVQECKKTWEKLNPNWEIIFLDAGTIGKYIKIDHHLDNEKFTRQIKANMTRLHLLKEHGGVWTDATVFCNRPLDEWLPRASLKTGFFVFSNPGKDRMISNWFIASTPHNYLLEKWIESYENFWKIGKTVPQSVSKIYYKIFHVIVKYLKLFPIIDKLFYFNKKYFGLFPYFSCHYSFAKEYNRNAEFKKMWDNSEKIDAGPPHMIKHFGLDKEPNEEIIEFMKNTDAPVFKLDWRCNLNENSVVNKLIELKK